MLDDIKKNNLRVLQFVADKPKRSLAKDCKSSASWYPCEYCYAKGTKIQRTENTQVKCNLLKQKTYLEERIKECENSTDSTNINHLVSLKNDIQKTINALNKKTNILWPSSTLGSEPRTRNSILNIVERIENNEKLSLDEEKGVVGRSLLLDLPDFNYVYDAPAEYLHSGCLGVVKKLTELTFDVGENRTRVTKRKLSSTKTFNELMLKTKVFKEFPRRARRLDFAVFKGQEFRNLCIFFFPLVLECIEPEAKERNLWLNLCYSLRASLIPTEEFKQIKLDDVNDCCHYFYKVFEQIFGPLNCTYNLHVLCGHMLEIRTHGPLTQTSAFKFESFYGEMRRSFVPGTVSPMKQICKNILLKRAISSHQCDNNIVISNYDTPLESNKFIYCYKNKEYLIYQVKHINDTEVTCNKVGQYKATFKETPNLNWATVGVFRKGGISADTTTIRKNEIKGKVLCVGKYLITCSFNVLNEK